MANTGYVNEEVRKMYGIPYNQLTSKQKGILHADSVRRAKLIEEREKAVLQNNLKAFEDEARMEKVLASIYKQAQQDILAKVTETVAKVEKAGGEWSYANQSALTRSRGLFEQITAELTKLGQKEQVTFTQGLSNIYTDQFLRQVYELGQTMTVKANFNRLNPALIKKTLDYPWSGAMFSDRLWQDKATLGRNLRIGLTQSMILGESIPQITDRINKGIDTSRYNAERVARTETKRVTYCAHNDAYEDMGVEELEYRCANGGDARTCAYCKADNGKHYTRGKEPTLPRHPNCRCVYIPVVSDEFGDNELNELTGSVRGAENYEQWEKAQKEKLQKQNTLTPEEKKYNALMDDINARYGAKETEITALQVTYDDLDKQYKDLAMVRRGLVSPQEVGFKNQQEYKLRENQIYTDMQKAREAIEEARRDLKDIERESAYLMEVGAKRVNTLEDYKVIRAALRKNTTFDYDNYADELVQMVARMDDDALAIHKGMTSIIGNNLYNSGGGAYYSPAKKIVNMKMSSNTHEAALGNGLKGSWQTKYHEEGHQLDHLLAKAEEVSGTSSSYIWAFTHTSTATGQAISSAIEKDILSFLNTAIQYSNDKEGCKYKSITNLTRISSDARYAFARYINYLTSNGVDRKVSCQLGILSDAIGLYTGDRISPHSYGLWGHDSSYNKQRGKSGATSETWATFCALRTCGSKEEVAYAQNIMPSTWNVLDEVYHVVAQYVAKNTLSY